MNAIEFRWAGSNWQPKLRGGWEDLPEDGSLSGIFAIVDIDGRLFGNESGPLVYGDLGLARISAEVLDVRMNRARGTTRVIEFQPDNYRKVDDVELSNGISSERAIDMIERGVV